MKRAVSILSVFWCVLFMISCAGAPPSPKSTAEGIGQGYIYLEELINTAGNLHDQAVTTPEQEVQLVKIFSEAKMYLDMAKVALGEGTESDAQAALNLAQALLMEARNRLQEAENK